MVMMGYPLTEAGIAQAWRISIGSLAGKRRRGEHTSRLRDASECLVS